MLNGNDNIHPSPFRIIHADYAKGCKDRKTLLFEGAIALRRSGTWY